MNQTSALKRLKLLAKKNPNNKDDESITTQKFSSNYDCSFILNEPNKESTIEESTIEEISLENVMINISSDTLNFNTPLEMSRNASHSSMSSLTKDISSIQHTNYRTGHGSEQESSRIGRDSVSLLLSLCFY